MGKLHDDKKKEIADQIGNRTTWLVSSTHEDEEFRIGKFLKDLGQKIPGVLTFIAPRHPHRGIEIKERLEKELGLTVSLRSANEKITPKTK